MDQIDFHFGNSQFGVVAKLGNCTVTCLRTMTMAEASIESGGEDNPDLRTVCEDVSVPAGFENCSPGTAADESSVWHEGDGDVGCDGDFGFVTYQSADGLKTWIPICPTESKPAIGMKFESIKAAFEFYEKYGKLCLFDIRKGSDKRAADGTITRKYILCNKEGKIPKSVVDSSIDGPILKPRKSPSLVTGCNARICLRRNGMDGYVISQFVEAHNHSMASDSGAQFLKSRRKTNFLHQKVVVDLSKINIGPVVAYKVYKGLAGGYCNVGATAADFKNIQRNIVAYIGEYDAQMLIEKLQRKKEVFPSFFFEFYVEEGVLKRLFWADPVSRRNYRIFGDVVSFDATYSLNKYRMIFVPFTGVDNHRKSVTFAAALISSENAESYTWVLEMFLKCMCRPPRLVITDQDAALRKVIPQVMPDVRHRFCMWHIMKKMSAKVGFVTPLSKRFRTKLSDIIYSQELEIPDFEKAWNDLIDKYHYRSNVWLSNMYKLRRFWIPAYFRDIPLGCLLMTTSRSESQNSFFGRFLNVRMNLLAFFSGFESAIENQRHTQALAEHDCLLKKAKTLTPLAIESDIRDIYTIRIFRDIQKEILASCYDLSVVNVSLVENIKTLELKDVNFQRSTFMVTHNQFDNDFSCSCKLFRRVGYQCSHVFFAMRSGGIDKIPRKYVLNRWTKHAVRMFGADEDLVKHCQLYQQGNRSSSLIWTEVQACIMLAADDDDKMERLTSRMKEMRIELESEAGIQPMADDRNGVMSKLIGASVPEVLTIKSPPLVHTKGSGKRVISQRELAISKAKKSSRRICGVCKKFVFHDKRNCPEKPIESEVSEEVDVCNAGDIPEDTIPI